jgi:hypothetical protein
MSRRRIPPAQLYAILDREFRARRPDTCKSCRTPLPFWKQPADEVSANWDVGTLAQCPDECRRLMGEIVAGLWSQYELDAPAKD